MNTGSPKLIEAGSVGRNEVNLTSSELSSRRCRTELWRAFSVQKKKYEELRWADTNCKTVGAEFTTPYVRGKMGQIVGALVKLTPILLHAEFLIPPRPDVPFDSTITVCDTTPACICARTTYTQHVRSWYGLSVCILALGPECSELKSTWVVSTQ